MTTPSMTTKDKLNAVRNMMKAHNIDAYIVPRADEFQGEFVAPYAERLKWLTGFTGSGGMALIFKDKAFALTDGRYLIQIKDQTDQNHFETGDYIKKEPVKWLIDNMKKGDVIGYDPYLHTPKQIDTISKETKNHGLILKAIEENLIDAVWQDQPERPQGIIKVFPDGIAGLTVAEKIESIAEKIKEKNARAFVCALPDSIAWLLNIRGSDIDYIPYALSYLIISRRGNVRWFVDPKKVSNEIREGLPPNVTIFAPDTISVQFMALTQAANQKEQPICMDMRFTPIHLKNMLEQRGAIVQHMIDPCIAPKASKTESEIAAIKKAHIEDAVALVKFLKWLESKGIGQTEISVTEKLKFFREESPYFKGNSFPTIAGFGANGAIIHYRANEKTNAVIESGSLLLIDSGGQYAGEDCYGTTDITRTIAIGEPTDEMRDDATRVLKGHIALAQARFPKGTTGAQIDAIARKPLWDAGLDYAHGTGHGVGCYLSVHEAAANISPKGQNELEEGMILSNEPGYYPEGEYGIRIENLVLVKKTSDKDKNKDSLYLETISYAPFDKRLINMELLDKSERQWLENYRNQIKTLLSPILDEEHRKWLELQ